MVDRKIISKNMIEDKKKELAALVAKTGVFFAQCDNDFSIEENQVIESYLKNIDKMGVSGLDKSCAKGLTIDKIIEETNAYSAGLKAEELTIFMLGFIELVIMADGKRDPRNDRNRSEIDGFDGPVQGPECD
jgi:hypothetical protein